MRRHRSALMFYINAIKEYPTEISLLSSDSLVYEQMCVTSSITLSPVLFPAVPHCQSISLGHQLHYNL